MNKLCLMLTAAAAALLHDSGPARAEAAAPPRLEAPASCDVAGLPEGARCGVLDVPEDRSLAGGRRLGLHFVVVPGEDPSAEPILFIAGGPGQSAIDVMPVALAEIRAVDRRRDVVFLDQRGTGRSNPLGCADGFAVIEGDAAAVRRCAAELALRADLARYGTADAVADLEALRSALGLGRVNLLAGSYGTRVALYYMREHPEAVRAAVLRAAAPLDFNIIAGGIAAADAELGRVIDDCAADSACSAAFPDLESRLAALSERLAAAPETVTVPAPDGGESRIEVSATLFQQTLYALMLAAPSRQQLPMVVATAERSGFQPLAPVVAQVRNQLYGALPVGMYLSVVCAEDAPRIGAAGLPAGRTAIVDTGARLVEACRAWPVPPAPASHLDQPRLATPTLVLTGAQDPATNIASGDRLAAGLARSSHLVMAATGHGPLFPECARAATARFLETADPAEARADCRAEPLPFAVPRLAAAAR